jgi:hypothetical protein
VPLKDMDGRVKPGHDENKLEGANEKRNDLI